MRSIVRWVAGKMGYEEHWVVGFTAKDERRAEDVRRRMEVMSANPESLRGLHPRKFKIWLRVRP